MAQAIINKEHGRLYREYNIRYLITYDNISYSDLSVKMLYSDKGIKLYSMDGKSRFILRLLQNS